MSIIVCGMKWVWLWSNLIKQYFWFKYKFLPCLTGRFCQFPSVKKGSHLLCTKYYCISWFLCLALRFGLYVPGTVFIYTDHRFTHGLWLFMSKTWFLPDWRANVNPSGRLLFLSQFCLKMEMEFLLLKLNGDFIIFLRFWSIVVHQYVSVHFRQFLSVLAW